MYGEGKKKNPCKGPRTIGGEVARRGKSFFLHGKEKEKRL